MALWPAGGGIWITICAVGHSKCEPDTERQVIFQPGIAAGTAHRGLVQPCSGIIESLSARIFSATGNSVSIVAVKPILSVTISHKY
jgi:hypothetical protein